VDAAKQLKEEILPPIENKILSNLKFMVYGYADTTGNEDGKNPEYNYRLSERRAEWVINQLAKRCGERIRGVLNPKGCGDACAPAGGKSSPPHRAVIIEATREVPAK
jgi:outer membrane protein OmpA-like peptidoglycan-associated protein